MYIQNYVVFYENPDQKCNPRGKEKELYDKYLIDGNEISDTIHTFGELYEYRMLYNALYVNELVKTNVYKVYKSKRHGDGEECFGGGWFIVVIELPTGKVDNHYKLEYWDLFKCEEVEKEPELYDGHTPQDVINRMLEYLGGK